jgi:threonine/homoserine/homoserine lactone efflux protein
VAVTGVGRGRTAQSDGLIRLVLGLLLLGLAFLAWKRRPRAGEALPMPKWVAGIDNFAPWKSFSFALVTSILNPKNLVLLTAAAVIMKETPSRAGDDATDVIIFILLCSLSVAVPVLFYAVAPDRAGPTLDRWREWLIHNSVVITVIVLLIFGVELVAKGLAGLLG